MMSFEIFKMGNYGAYIWASYALTLLALVVMSATARSASKRELKAARRRIQMNVTSSTQNDERVSMSEEPTP